MFPGVSYVPGFVVRSRVCHLFLGVSPVPGCGATRLWLLVRHGSRFPGDDDIERINTLLPQIIQTADFDSAKLMGTCITILQNRNIKFHCVSQTFDS